MSEFILTDQNFEKEVMENEKPVLVDFWAPGCAPCIIMTPIIEEIAEKFEGKVKVGKLNVAENQKTAARFGIRGVPTFIIFKDGKAIERVVGARPKRVLVEKLNLLL